MNFIANKFENIENIRIFQWLLLLFFFVLTQILQADFIPIDLLNPAYLALSIAFFLHTIFLLTEKNNLYFQISIFLLDSLLITYIAASFPAQLSLFIFLFLLQILYASLLFQSRGAYLVAFLSSLCLSFLVLQNPEIQGQNRNLSIGVNNIAFFVVAFLGGRLSEQIEFLDTRLERTSSDLQILKDLNHLIIQNMRSAFFSLDDYFRIILFNDKAQELSAKTLRLQRSIHEIFPDFQVRLLQADRSKFQKAVVFDIEEDEQVLQMNFSYVFEKEKVIGGILVVNDVTEIRKLERQIQRKEKLAAVGQLAAGIAHEIRNPLASMSGSLQFLQEDGDRTEEENKLIQIVLKEIDRLNSLITDFLEFVKPEKMQKERVSLKECLEETVRTIQRDPNLNEVQVHWDIREDFQIEGSYSRLKQVFLNLIINAHHALENKQDPILMIRVFSQESRVEIEDNGVGMSEETQRRLFEPFHTTKAKGTGLGLAMVHKILEMHDAMVEVASKEGIGTKFSIDFKQS